MTPSGLTIVAMALGVCVALVFGCVAYLYYGRLWFKAQVAKAPVPILRMVRMTFSGASAHRVVMGHIEARGGGLDVTLDELETFARGDGDALRAVREIVEAAGRGERMTLDDMRRIEGTSEDVLEKSGQSA